MTTKENEQKPKTEETESINYSHAETDGEKVTYKTFVLDPFQVGAIHAIEKHHSVVVSAATGTGKTLIADYAINKFMKAQKRVIYTAPIKALSNQKFRDFTEEYGRDSVGIMTGDVVINAGAPILIMTTEIYRNMLMTKDPVVDSISYVVYDEIHYMSDEERGTIWEESIIFSPEHIRFVCLSATIPNAQEFADWISTIKKHPVDVVSNTKRAVPLKHSLYDVDYGILSMDEAKNLDKNNQLPDYYKLMRNRRKKGKKGQKPVAPKHYDLVKVLKDRGLVPCIFFVFSRRGCEEKARELSMKEDFLSKSEKNEVVSLFHKHVKEEYRSLDSVAMVKNAAERGIGVHHAGLLPFLKEIIERLFAKGLIKVLYATETFAVGINMPAKSVAFNSLIKFNGKGFAILKGKEYFQMAGRAGRRGLDEYGEAIALLERRSELGKIIELTQGDSEPIISQFKLGPNTVLNMLHNYSSTEQIDTILKSNFDYYMKKRDDVSIRIRARFNNLVKKLTRLGYINEDQSLTDKGIFATKIYAREIVITELFFSDLYKKLNDTELCVLIGTIVYEWKKNDEFYSGKKGSRYRRLYEMAVTTPFLRKELHQQDMKSLWPVISHWANGGSFEELLELCNFQEGDYIRLFRQMIDCMNQIKHATTDVELEDRITQCMNKIYRDIITFEM